MSNTRTLCCWFIKCDFSDGKKKSDRLDRCSLSSGKIIASTVLLSLTVWLVLKVTEPSCYITKFDLKAFKDPTSSLIDMEVALSNSDLYKGIDYNALYIRNYCILCSTAVTNLPTGNLSGYLPPGTSRTVQQSYDLNLTHWGTERGNLSTGSHYFKITIFMVYQYKMLSWKSRTHQLIKVANIYFNSSGDPFIPRPSGLPLL